MISIPPLMRHCLFSFVLSSKIYDFKVNLSTQRVKRDLKSQGAHDAESLTTQEVQSLQQQILQNKGRRSSPWTAHALPPSKGALENATATPHVSNEVPLVLPSSSFPSHFLLFPQIFIPTHSFSPSAAVTFH